MGYLRFPSSIDASDLKGIKYLCELADLLLWKSADAIASGTLPAQTLLGCVAAIFQKHIAEHGNELCKRAYSKSSGRIPKELRPNAVSRDGCWQNPYDIFQGECIGRIKGWSYEYWMPDGPIYQPHGLRKALSALHGSNAWLMPGIMAIERPMNLRISLGVFGRLRR